MHAKLGSENQNSSCEHEHLQISTILLTFRGSGGKFRKFSVKSLGVSAKHVEKIVAGFRSAVFFQPNFFFQGQTCPPPHSKAQMAGRSTHKQFLRNKTKQNETNAYLLFAAQVQEPGGGGLDPATSELDRRNQKRTRFSANAPKKPKRFFPQKHLVLDHF